MLPNDAASSKVTLIPAPVLPNGLTLVPGRFNNTTTVPFGATKYAYRPALYPPLMSRPTVMPVTGESKPA